jgi:hypothetical protein
MRRVFDVVMLLGAMLAVSAVAAAQGTTVQPSTTPPGQQTPPPARPSQTPPPSAQTPVPTIPTTVEPARAQRQPTAPALPTITANVKLDLTITDTYTGTPVKKTVSMLILNGSNGMIRTSNRLATGFVVGLNVDAAAMIHQGGFITVRVTFEYTPAQTIAGIAQTDDVAKAQAEQKLSPRAQPAELHESLSVILQDGKPLLVSQSADPTTDRKVTVELIATVLK